MTKQIPKKLINHGHTRIDNYYWLNQRDNNEVLDYLKQENKHTELAMQGTEVLQQKIFSEIKSRIKQDDSSVPYKQGDYYYHHAFKEELDYPIYYRQKDLNGALETILDLNLLAKNHTYCQVANIKISTNQKLLAYALDLSGRRIYNIYIKDLTNNKIIDVIHNTTASIAWDNRNEKLFYGKQDPDTLRANKIYQHTLNTNIADKLIFEEKDFEFDCYVYKSRSEKYIHIVSSSKNSTEYRTFDCNKNNDNFVIFYPRQKKLEYHIEDHNNDFYILTNYQATNFCLMKTHKDKTNITNWQKIIAHNSDILLEDFLMFNNYLVTQEKINGLNEIKIRDLNGNIINQIKFDDPCYSSELNYNPSQNSNKLRYSYTSLTTPNSIYDYNMDNNTQILKKQNAVLGDFNNKNYISKRIWATATDGTKIPISLVYNKNLVQLQSSPAPLILYAYGSYGHSIEPYFSSSRLSLIDRGYIFAIAHVRGGEELGRHWYDQGKLLNKKNTFTDFIACTEHLINNNYTTTKQCAIWGGSAGGLLVAAVLNMRSELFNAAVLEVPFVDALTTMLDSSIPLTTGEYQEWGDPDIKEYYDYILSYSPYDNIAKKDYPHILVTTGLHDSQVQYWEPAKWVAKLKSLKTDNNTLMLKTDFSSGHGGASARDEEYKEIAFLYSFLISYLNYSN